MFHEQRANKVSATTSGTNIDAVAYTTHMYVSTGKSVCVQVKSMGAHLVSMPGVGVVDVSV